MKRLNFVVETKIYLSGCSTGNFVTIIIRERLQYELKGLILYSPALFIKDFEKILFWGK